MTYDRYIERVPVGLPGARGHKSWPHILSPEGRGDGTRYAENLSSLMASKSCTPPPTRLVV
jgi:hypothetical protein